MGGFEIVVVQNRIEEHPEFAVILPAITRVRRKQQHATAAYGHIYDGGTIRDFGCAAHQSTQHGFIAAGIAHQDLAHAVCFRHVQERPIRIAHRNRFLVVAVKNRMRSLQDFGFDNRASA